MLATFSCVWEIFDLRPIGRVHSSRSQPEDDRWDQETSLVELVEPFDERSIRGLETFSHCIVVYVVDQASWDETRMLRHPRSNAAWPEVGIFAQRAKDRPNRLGVAICRILVIDGAQIHLADLDAIDGSPVVDIKPWMVEFGPRGEVAQPQWATELMKNYW